MAPGSFSPLKPSPAETSNHSLKPDQPEPKVKDILSALENLAPAVLAEPWDKVGLMVGSVQAPVKGVMVALDADESAVAAALAAGLNCLVAHHPLIFRPLGRIDPESLVGRVLKAALGQDLAVLAAHTNLDSAPGGVGDVLAGLVGLQEPVPLMPHPACAQAGLGRVGDLARPVSLKILAGRIKKALGLTSVRVSGCLDQMICRLAVVGGSGSGTLEAAKALGAEALLAGEIGHHAALEAEALGLALIEAGHFATEAPMVPVLAARLGEELAGLGFGIPVQAHLGGREPLRPF